MSTLKKVMKVVTFSKLKSIPHANCIDTRLHMYSIYYSALETNQFSRSEKSGVFYQKKWKINKENLRNK